MICDKTVAEKSQMYYLQSVLRPDVSYSLKILTKGQEEELKMLRFSLEVMRVKIRNEIISTI